MSANSSPARMEGRASTSSTTSSAPAHQELEVGSSAIKSILQEGIFLPDCWFHEAQFKGNALCSLKNVPKAHWVP